MTLKDSKRTVNNSVFANNLGTISSRKQRGCLLIHSMRHSDMKTR